jgi:prepilin peptidase CpaA
MSLTSALTWLFAATLIVALLWDAARLEIPDAASLILLAGFGIGFALGGAGWEVFFAHAGAGLAAFAAGAGLFYLGVWGGGDAKLGGAVALWLGWGGLAPWIFAVALTGGVLSLAILLLRRAPAHALANGPMWLQRLHRPDEGIPYGIAIGLGALTLSDRAALFAVA